MSLTNERICEILGMLPSREQVSLLEDFEVDRLCRLVEDTTDPSLIHNLTKTRHLRVQEKVLYNPSVSDETLKWVAMHGSLLVRVFAEKTLAERKATREKDINELLG